MGNRDILAGNSYNELLDLSNFFNRYGPIPIIIGGWAVYIYNSYYGSVDIDIVGPSMGGMFNNLLTEFQIANGYELRYLDEMGIEKVFEKKIFNDGNIIGNMEIDACSYEQDLKYFHENHEKMLPYDLCDLYHNRLKLPEASEIIIPTKTLLLLFKIKALRDRKYDYDNNPLLSPQRRNWLSDKIIKDASDIISLLDPNPASFILTDSIDIEIFRNIMSDFDIRFILITFRDILNMDASLTLYRSIDKNVVERWIQPFANL